MNDVTGRKSGHSAKADISKVEEYFGKPEPCEALARDGKTKIYGIIIKPYDFDENKKYPVVDYIYGGAQRINTPKAFELNRMPGMQPHGALQYYAHLGFLTTQNFCNGFTSSFVIDDIRFL